jgi:molybdopterin/thiamine biosynthesis adenylyltransferase
LRINRLIISEGVLGKDDRFDRFKLINWWEQERLQKAKILVIGAGALGNEILKNLALLGVGNIFIADMDIIENSNLSRSILFRENDNGSIKSEAAARAIKDIYPDINVQWFQGNIVYDLGLGVYHWADLVIAGLDNREARLAINRNCWKTNTPWIDGAIEQLNGVARVFVPPNGACYECTMGEKDWQILKQRKACNLLSREDMIMGKIPTTPTSASVIAGIQCQEAVKLLHGLEVLESKGYIFNGLTHDSYLIHYQRKEECFSHETYTHIKKLDKSVTTTTLAELIKEVKKELGDEAIIEFNTEILHFLECNNCGKSETVLDSIGKIPEKKGYCPSCGNMRNTITLHSIDGNEPFLDKTFAEIGIPPFDIIVGRVNMNQVFLEFSQDAANLLGPLYNAHSFKTKKKEE